MTEARPPFMQPNAIERFFNRFFGTLVGWGLGPSYNYLLQVEGRKTGRIYSTPVNVVDFNGKHFLVAPRGETQWVRNARANGQLWLKKGRTRLRYSLREVRDQEKPEILREYLNRYKTTVQRYFPVAAGSPREAFLPLVTQYPTFELLAQ